MNTNLYNEIANTHIFEMEQQALMNHARMFLTHYRELSSEEKNKKPERSYILTASTEWNEKIYLGNADRISRWEDLDENDAVINVIHFDGPMMRNGGMCAYGSLELRDMIMEAADVKQCIGHIFVCDTPGGNSYSKFDLQEAIEYAHGKGQITIMYVDGMLCSAGMAWGALCRKIYARSTHCILGCMGTYGCFQGNKDGDKNTITQEVIRIVYADESPLKNREYRDALEGDDALIKAEINKSDRQYKEIIRAGIPNVTEEQLKGGTWEAGEVIGTLCDGIRKFEDVVNEILETKGVQMTKGGNETSVQEFKHTHTDTSMQEKKQGTDEPEDTEDPEDPENPDMPGNPNKPVDPNEPEDNKDDTKKKSQNNKNMGKKYENIRAALGQEVLESGKDNSLWLHEDMADALEEFILKTHQTKTALDAKVEEVKQLTEQIKTIKSEHAVALELAKKEMNEAAEEKLKEVNTAKSVLETQLETLTQERDDLKKTVEQKEKEISELAEKPGEQKHPALEAALHITTNESSVQLPSKFSGAKEQREARKKFMEEIKKRM